MRFGANYTPSQQWWHAWLDFDPGSISRDLDDLAGLGLDHVRVFPIWPVFQPNRGVVRERAVEQLLELVRLAAAAGLDVSVDGIQGHLSSFDFYPSWTQTWHQRNVFTDPDVLAGQALLLRTLATALRGEPNYLGMTLGNEMNNLVPHNPCTPEQVDAWIDHLLAVCAQADPDHPHCHSAFDDAWYVDGHPFTPQASARKGAMTTVHPWVFSLDCARRYGPLSTEVTHLAEYGTELARAYGEVGRVIWVQELGAPDPHIPVADAPEYAAQTLANVTTCADVWGVTWWCSHDVDRRFVDYPVLEYGLGLLRTDGSRKPLAETVSRAVRELRSTAPQPAVRKTALVFEGGGLDSRRESGPGGAFFEAWMRLAAQGVRVATVLADRSDDSAYLAARGITELVQLGDVT
ncbi:cellulase family glycosylhydrolase [Kutzneria viridogrisea]|uniref:Endo-1,4-beta-mannosidase n=1 Tax=Kutzneria viridogrisea TaxID=47990 RepID=A0ABR6BI29_9PSEU|nr:endo-1,4-beta-mannosidase [Kutzneria viridogrisea]